MPNRTLLIAGNWKMNNDVAEAAKLADELAQALPEVPAGVEVLVCPPTIDITTVRARIQAAPIALGAQNVYWEAKGAYTGESSCDMLKSAGCTYCIIGHSERRQYYGETDEKLVEKVKLALEAGLGVILCVGENLEEREAGKHFDVCSAQIENVLYKFTAEDMKKVIVAYEPVWAIGTGKTATAEQAEEIHAHIRKVLADKFGEAVAEDTTILYGGSCKPSNAKELFAQKDIDGGLIGGASLKAEDFSIIVKAASK